MFLEVGDKETQGYETVTVPAVYGNVEKATLQIDENAADVPREAKMGDQVASEMEKAGAMISR